MSWSKVGDWIKDNAGSGVALVGSLLTGNVPGAIAAGVSMVSSATGTNDPDKALAILQGDPQSMIKLKELYYQDQDSIRKHIQVMTQLELEDQQREHESTQVTIRDGDKSEDTFVRRTRPGQSWCSLFAAFAYVFVATSIDITVLGLLLTLPWAYAGLREVGKGISSFNNKASSGVK